MEEATAEVAGEAETTSMDNHDHRAKADNSNPHMLPSQTPPISRDTRTVHRSPKTPQFAHKELQKGQMELDAVALDSLPVAEEQIQQHQLLLLQSRRLENAAAISAHMKTQQVMTTRSELISQLDQYECEGIS